MNDLRERFRVLDDVPVPPRIAASLPPFASSAPRRASGRRVGTVVAAFVLAATSFAILVRAFGPGSQPHDRSDVDAGSFSVEVGRPIQVGDGPNAVAVGAGAVWVSALPGDGPPYSLLRLDPITGEVVARIPVPALPTWEVGGGGMVALPDGVWVTGAVDDSEGRADAIVFRVDPATNEVAEEIDLGPGFGADLWIDESGVWVLIFDEHPDPGISVIRLHVASLEEVARVHLPTDWAKQVFAFAGSIWVQGNRENSPETVVPDVLFRIDPATNRFRGTFALPTEEFSLAVDGISVWQRAPDGVIRIDPGRQPVRVALEGVWDQCSCIQIASDGDGGLWALGKIGPDRVQVVHVSADGERDRRAEAEVPDAVLGSVAIAFDHLHQTLWLAQYEDTVTPLRIVRD
jgi:hypothetical protein